MEEIANSFVQIWDIDFGIGCKQSFASESDMPHVVKRPTFLSLPHSISDLRAEISWILVMVHRSSSTSRGTTYWFKYFCCFELRVFRFVCVQSFATEMFTVIKKNDALKGIKWTASSF